MTWVWGAGSVEKEGMLARRADGALFAVAGTESRAPPSAFGAFPLRRGRKAIADRGIVEYPQERQGIALASSATREKLLRGLMGALLLCPVQNANHLLSSASETDRRQQPN